jgi:hypothetical protein
MIVLSSLFNFKRLIQCEEVAYNFPLSNSYEANFGELIFVNDVWIVKDALILWDYNWEWCNNFT